MSDLIVLKFGSSVLQNEQCLPAAVHEIYRHVRAGRRVVAVVSALGNTTDALVARAHAWCDAPPAAAYAALLATGEAETAALLSLALDRAGVPSEILDANRAGLRTEGPICDSRPTALDRGRMLRLLDRVPVVVLPGFLGRDNDERTTLLGRGGSDLTALFVAWQLQAHCRLVKDVDGIYDCDPATNPQAARFSRLNWEDAAQLGGAVVQPKGVSWAQERGLVFEVGCLGSAAGTLVGPGPNVVAESEPARSPTRVVLLGLGTVGLGVYRALCAQPDAFEVVAIAVRDVASHTDHAPADLLCSDALDAVRRPTDLVVECIGGTSVAVQAVQLALDTGRSVVTANKAIIARDGRGLDERARRSGAALRYSAAVGGSVPAIESVRRLAQSGVIDEIEAVLNGTCNFVLDRLHDGVSFDDAVVAAQKAGFAEADPTLDLDGTDAAHKLAILAREAFGAELVADWIDRSGLDKLDLAEIEAADGGRVRLVARCRRTPSGLQASVRTELRRANGPLGSVRGEHNAVTLRPATGRTLFISGKGAGRWPTTEAIVADCIDLRALAARPATAVAV